MCSCHGARPDAPEPTVARSGRPLSEARSDVLRTCRRHGEGAHGHYGGRYRCKRCVAESVTRRHQKVRSILLEEAGGACAVCGYDACVINLHFHHVDPAAKAMSMHMGRGRSLTAYRAEATKCVLVCANCHGEIETGLIPSPPAEARWPGAPTPDPHPK